MLRGTSTCMLIRPSLWTRRAGREIRLNRDLSPILRRGASKHSVTGIFQSTLRRARVLANYNVQPTSGSAAGTQLGLNETLLPESQDVDDATQVTNAFGESSDGEADGRHTTTNTIFGGQDDVTQSESDTKRRKTLADWSTDDMKVLTVNDLPYQLLDVHRSAVPRLAHGLDRVLFNPGVYNLRDPRSRVYNFDPYIERILPPEDFDFDALSGYQTASVDPTLAQIADTHDAKYYTSTSNASGMLKHFHFLLSQWRPLTFSMMSKGFDAAGDEFTRFTMAPEAVFLRKSGQRYAIDKDKEFDSGHILGLVGRTLEKLLTVPREAFEQYRLSNQKRKSPRDDGQGYHYSMSDSILVRSQLDAHDPRVPGTGIFDIKTRAVVSVRMDKGLQLDVAKGYQLVSRLGTLESYEREYFDMIRSMMLKYSLQVRLGYMDGIFCAYHNLDRMFGFQYISLEDMDLALHGQTNPKLGDEELKVSMKLLEEALDRIVRRFPDQHVRVHFITRKRHTPVMHIVAENVTDQEIAAIEGAAEKRVQEFERSILSANKPADELERTELEQKVAREEIMEDIEDGNGEEERDEDASQAIHEVVGGNQQGKGTVYRKLEDIRERIFGHVVTIEGLAVAALNIYCNLMGKQPGPFEAQLLKLLQRTGTAENALRDEIATFSAQEWSIHLVEAASQLEDTMRKLEEALKMQKEQNAKLVARRAADSESDAADPGTKPSSTIEDTKEDGETIAELKALQRKTRDTMEDIVMLRRVIKKASSRKSKASATDTNTVTPPEAPASSEKRTAPVEPPPPKEYYALTLAIRNIVNGRYVTRPENLKRDMNWQVEYAFREIEDQAEVADMCSGIKNRRAKLEQLEADEKKLRLWYEIPFMRELMRASERGHARRKREEAWDEKQGRRVVFVSNEERSGSESKTETAVHAEKREGNKT